MLLLVFSICMKPLELSEQCTRSCFDSGAVAGDLVPASVVPGDERVLLATRNIAKKLRLIRLREFTNDVPTFFPNIKSRKARIGFASWLFNHPYDETEFFCSE